MPLPLRLHRYNNTKAECHVHREKQIQFHCPLLHPHESLHQIVEGPSSALKQCLIAPEKFRPTSQENGEALPSSLRGRFVFEIRLDPCSPAQRVHRCSRG